ncbi:ferredoxin [bacterium (Candidatus Howlettbacteria) CG_4_10_14_0_8_um_filter_40_9]|nr:MAG: ferredoxin [bacterium (Candidatus Howlettbacteria) CG_4_10_14_0_8_um_filter_40_9]
MVKIDIDHDLCIGCGTCESICSEVFEVRDDGKSHVKEGVDLETVDKNLLAEIKDAEDSCPEQAIIVKE